MDSTNPPRLGNQGLEMKMTYYINLENTGLDTDTQVKRMAEIMQNDGHDVEYTHNFGAIQKHGENGDVISCPVNDQEWMRYLELAANA